jgi:tRNA dimethylallyltransferase
MMVTQDLRPLVAIVGPTGSGKSALAEVLALQFNGEIVSCDAKQIFRYMDIGTNKERDLRVPQHLIDLKEPGEKVTVAEYQHLAYQEIDRLHGQGKLPFLVGVSMLYAEAVLNGYIFSEDKKSTKQQPRYRALKLGIAVERSELQRKQEIRTQQWVEQGLLGEIQSLLDSGVSAEWLDACGQEYRFFTRHLLGKISIDEAVRLTNISLNQYTKRQYTWWRRHPDIHWISGSGEAENLVNQFLHN